MDIEVKTNKYIKRLPRKMKKRIKKNLLEHIEMRNKIQEFLNK